MLLSFIEEQPLTKILLWIGALFFLVEFFLHFFALGLLEHDKIFIPTHDRYIAAYALILSGLSIFVSTDLRKYNALFVFTLIMMFFGFIIAMIIAFEGGYSEFFPVIDLDKKLGGLGTLFVVWYFFTWIAWWRKL